MYRLLIEFVSKYCQTLFLVFGKQIVLIQEHQGASASDGGAEARKKRDELNAAKEMKHTLESILYDTFIMISIFFKKQLFEMSQKLWEAKLHTWMSS